MKKYHSISVPSLEHLPNAAQDFLKKINQPSIVTLTGDLGAGKTTFVKEVCASLGVVDIVNSPTFSIVNEYQTKGGDPVFHMDLYRLKNIEEAIDIGLEDYLYRNNWCFIEWPGVAAPILPPEVIQIQIKNIDESARNILFL